MAGPDFFLIGAPKTGTTALHAALALHPQVFMSPVKEPKFFLCDGPPPRQNGPGDAHSAREWVWRTEDYEALFAPAPAGTLRGESTPFYLSDPDAHLRIRAARPDARLIAVLRDPVDRAYSNWTHLWSDGLEPIGDFVGACAREDERAAAGWARFWRYVGLGRYGEQLQHLFGVFPRDQVHVLRYMDLITQPQEALDRICQFLGIAPGVMAELPAQNVSTYVPPSPTNRCLQAVVRRGAAAGRHFRPELWRTVSAPLLRVLQRNGHDRPELSPDERRQLLPRFEEDIRVLEAETGHSFGDWLGQRGAGAYSVRKSWAPSAREAS